MWYQNPVRIQYRSIWKSLELSSLDCCMTESVRNQYRHEKWRSCTALGFEPARARCAFMRTDHWANQTPHELAHADPTVYIHTYIGYCIAYMQCTAITIPTCMAEPHTKFVWWKHIQKCTRVTKRNPEKSSLPQHRTIDPLPSTNFFPGLRFLALGVAFCCPEAE